MGIRSGEASVAAGAAAVSAPSGPDCGGDRRWRGQGTAAEGEGSEKARRRGGAGARKLVEGRWGGGEGGGFSGGGAAREGDESLRRQEQRVRAGGKPRKLYPGSGAGAVRHLGGPLCPILCQLPTLDVFILAAPTRSAPSAQWETLPAQ